MSWLYTCAIAEQVQLDFELLVAVHDASVSRAVCMQGLLVRGARQSRHWSLWLHMLIPTAGESKGGMQHFVGDATQQVHHAGCLQDRMSEAGCVLRTCSSPRQANLVTAVLCFVCLV